MAFVLLSHLKFHYIALLTIPQSLSLHRLFITEIRILKYTFLSISFLPKYSSHAILNTRNSGGFYCGYQRVLLYPLIYPSAFSFTQSRKVRWVIPSILAALLAEISPCTHCSFNLMYSAGRSIGLRPNFTPCFLAAAIPSA